MRLAKARHVGATAICLALLSHAAPSIAQDVEVSPFYGYRFGGGFVDLYTAQPFDFDGAPATGVVFDVRLYDSDDFQIEGLFTHQAAAVLVSPGAGRPVSASKRKTHVGFSTAQRKSFPSPSPSQRKAPSLAWSKTQPVNSLAR